jgi:hypothetical protein
VYYQHKEEIKSFKLILNHKSVVTLLAKIERTNTACHADGFAVTCHYNGIYLSDLKLDSVWTELDRRRAMVFVHPNAYALASLSRPNP